MTQSITLSSNHIAPLMHARRKNAGIVRASLDLGISEASIRVFPDCVIFPNEQWLDWNGLEKIAGNETGCYVVTGNNQFEKIQKFSPQFNRHYSLMPTAGAPTMLISGIPMHRIKETDPWRDTKEKIRAAGPLTGAVLDTATGLGYTALGAVRKAPSVTTIELDPTVLDICRLNPWSQELFESPKINQKLGDALDVVQELPDARFQHVIHDPPMFSLAGHLYSEEFYRELWRVLRPGGKLFHYIGNPESKSGRTVTRGAWNRLQSAGFVRIQRRPRAFGLVALKPRAST